MTGMYRRLKATCAGPPPFPAAATRRSSSADVIPGGFSRRSGRPSSSTGLAARHVASGGTAITTASGLSAESIAGTSEYHRRNPKASAYPRARSGSGSQHAASSASGWDARYRCWAGPWHRRAKLPHPIMHSLRLTGSSGGALVADLDRADGAAVHVEVHIARVGHADQPEGD